MLALLLRVQINLPQQVVIAVSLHRCKHREVAVDSYHHILSWWSARSQTRWKENGNFGILLAKSRADFYDT